MTVVISKLEAAERLIVSGIAMLDRGDDPLAIHVVASSALNMLRELIQKSGDNYAARVLKDGLFYTASTRITGGSITLPTNPELDELIQNVVEGMEAGEINQPSDLTVNLDKEQLRKLLDYIIRPFNFLKHAQRDPLATLDESDVDPKGAIIHALTAFSMLDPGKKLPSEVATFLEANNLA